DRALTAAALAHDDEPIERLDPERHAVEHRFSLEAEPDIAQLDHVGRRRAHAGKQTVEMTLKSVSKPMTVVTEDTTLEVVPAPTPAAPPPTCSPRTRAI